MEADVAIVTRTFRAMETDKVKITRGTMLFRLYRPCAMVCLMAQITAANVVLMGTNLTLSFDDVEATFAPGVKGSGVNGIVYTAEPLNACSALTNKTVKGPPSTFALIIRGGCTFDEKVKNAQDAGFEAAIVYDNENSGDLDSMAGSSSGIHIYAVFISKVSGEVLKNFLGSTDVEVVRARVSLKLTMTCGLTGTNGGSPEQMDLEEKTRGKTEHDRDTKLVFGSSPL